MNLLQTLSNDADSGLALDAGEAASDAMFDEPAPVH